MKRIKVSEDGSLQQQLKSEVGSGAFKVGANDLIYRLISGFNDKCYTFKCFLFKIYYVNEKVSYNWTLTIA